MAQCPDHDLANMQTAEIAAGGSISSCWCQHSNGAAVADHASEGGNSWSTCLVRAAAEPPVAEEPATDTGCLTDMYRTNYFTDGEQNIGSFDSVAQCVQAVKDQCPEHDIANVAFGSLPNASVGSCWCQHSKGEAVADHVEEYAGWASCSVRAADGAAEATTDPTPDTIDLPMNGTEGFADGCHSEWVKSNYFTNGERNIGSFNSKAECVQAVLTECPDHDLANVPTACEHGGACSSCWCQHSGGETVAAH